MPRSRIRREDDTVTLSSAAQARLSVLIGLLVVSCVLVFFVTQLWDYPIAGTDSTLDWLVVKAAQNGVNPYRELADLADLYEVKGSFSGIAPRTPGSILLLSGLGRFTPTGAYHLTLLVNAGVFLGFVLWPLPILARLKRLHTLAVGPLLLVSAPVRYTFRLGQQSLIVAALVSGAWITMRRRPVVAGVAVGVAAVLKLWPLFLLVPFTLEKRWRATWSAIVTFLAVNAIGSVYFHIPVSDALSDLMAARSFIGLSRNGSLVAWLGSGMIPGVVAIASGAVAVVWAWKRYPEMVTPFAITVALLVTPVSWEHYGTVLLAVAAWSLAAGRWSLLLGSAWLVWQELALFTGLLAVGPQVGLVVLLGRVVLLFAVLASKAGTSAAARPLAA